MLGVKLTSLIIVLTIIWRFVSAAIIENKDRMSRYMIYEGMRQTWYLNLLTIMILLDFAGVIYSTIYFCFLR